MSVLFQTNHSSLIDHRDYISNVYKHVMIGEQESSLTITAQLFSIKNIKNVGSGSRKRSHNRNCVEIHEETEMIKQMYETLKPEIMTEIMKNLKAKYDLLDTRAVRSLAHELFERTVFEHAGISGGNDSSQPLKCNVKGECFLIPQKSRFFCGCVKEQCQKLEGNKFDILIADPPWWNKYIRRLKGANDKLSYTMMYNEDIASIPVKSLLSDNSLVAVWCTNSPSNIAAVKELIFPAWGVQYLTTWYWLKLTIDLEPLCNFGIGSQKQPYERLMLGKVGDLKSLPERQLFASIPSALHSHKPPLLDLLSPYVITDAPQTLELFARYLLPHATSVGYQPLKWQHISLYENVT